MDRIQIDRTTTHACPGLLRDAAYFAGLARPFVSCVNCEVAIPVHYVQFAHLCGDCRRECTDETDVAEARCEWCGEVLS